MKAMKKVMPGMLVAMGLVFLLSGCAETAGTLVATDHLSGNTLIVEDSTRLKDQIEVVRVNYDEVNGLKRVHVTLQSTRHKRLRLNYRIAWFDANGMELDPATKTYRNLLVEGREAVTVTGVANSAAGIESKVRVRNLEAAD